MTILGGDGRLPGEGVDLHPENLTPLVGLRLTPKVINPAGWLEVKPFLVAWVTAGAAYIELDGAVMPPAQVAAVDDVADLYGTRIVFVDQELAADALSVLRPARQAGEL